MVGENISDISEIPFIKPGSDNHPKWITHRFVSMCEPASCHRFQARVNERYSTRVFCSAQHRAMASRQINHDLGLPRLIVDKMILDDPPRWPQAIIKSSKPCWAYRRIMCSMTGLPPMVTIGLGLIDVSSDSRVPFPPASKTTLTIQETSYSSNLANAMAKKRPVEAINDPWSHFIAEVSRSYCKSSYEAKLWCRSCAMLIT